MTQMVKTSSNTNGADPSDGCGIGMVGSRVAHWPEYSMEAAGLALFMFLVCLYATLLQHPESPLHCAVSHPLWRRSIMGLAVGTTLASIAVNSMGKTIRGFRSCRVTSFS